MIIKKFKTKIISPYPICDVEISNNIANPRGGDWFYDESDIITVGLIEKNKIIIIQREKSDSKEEFVNAISNLLPKNFYAFNLNMEKGGLKGFTGVDYEVNEVKIFCGKGWNKDKFFNEVKTIITPLDNIDDPLNGDGSLCIPRYGEEKYEDIIKHNVSCLTKEAYILKFKNAILKKYKDKIDEKGWIKNGSP